jgi:predicted enzyme related to lactoylglutathione lyase
MMGKVVGLGGVFVKSADAKAWRDWYGRVLGVTFEEFGAATFAHPKSGLTTLAGFGAETDYFAPSDAQFMINLIVEDIDGVLATAEAAGEKAIGRQDESYGRFAWLLDPAGIKVELWEPVEDEPV